MRMERTKVKKGDFERRLLEFFPNSRLAKRPYIEYSLEQRRPIPMTLYYADDKHVGTWCKGEGWVS